MLHCVLLVLRRGGEERRGQEGRGGGRRGGRLEVLVGLFEMSFDADGKVKCT